MMINLKDITYVKIGSVLLSIGNIKRIDIREGKVIIDVDSDLMQAGIQTKFENVELVAVEE